MSLLIECFVVLEFSEATDNRDMAGLSKSKICSLYIYINEAFTIVFDEFFRYSICWNIYFITLGMMPIYCYPCTSVRPVPIVQVFPLPVWPYAKTAALQP